VVLSQPLRAKFPQTPRGGKQVRGFDKTSGVNKARIGGLHQVLGNQSPEKIGMINGKVKLSTNSNELSEVT